MMENEVLVKTPEEAIETIKSNMPTSGYQMLRESLEMAITALKEIQQYRKIGTVEECREATELQKLKKPIPINHKEYADKIVNAEFLEDTYLCPNCKTVIRSDSHCGRCGQKLNWNLVEV